MLSIKYEKVFPQIEVRFWRRFFDFFSYTKYLKAMKRILNQKIEIKSYTSIRKPEDKILSESI